MTRDEMINVLKDCPFTASLTCLPSEGALECLYVSKNGFAEEWINESDWPGIKVSNLSNSKLDEIKTKINEHTLTLNDLKDTGLHELFTSRYSEENKINEIFWELTNINRIENDLYAIYSTTTDNLTFFENYESFRDNFSKIMSSNIEFTAWENLDDEELGEWIEGLKEFEEIPCFEYGEDVQS